jgi:hypothetical protein
VKTPSATSLPRAPRDESSARFRNYVILMTVRIVCFLLVLLITPYGWHTWLLAIGAVFLPYIAVMVANVGSQPPPSAAESPNQALPSTVTPAPDAATPAPDAGHQVIRITEATPPKPAQPRERVWAPEYDPGAAGEPSGTDRGGDADTGASAGEPSAEAPERPTP